MAGVAFGHLLIRSGLANPGCRLDLMGTIAVIIGTIYPDTQPAPASLPDCPETALSS